MTLMEFFINVLCGTSVALLLYNTSFNMIGRNHAKNNASEYRYVEKNCLKNMKGENLMFNSLATPSLFLMMKSNSLACELWLLR